MKITKRQLRRIIREEKQKVLVENRIQDQPKLFGRNKFNNSVIFIGEEKNVGKIVEVQIESSNQNNLFGKIKNNENIKAA